MTLEELENTKPSDRLAKVRHHQGWLESLNESDLDEVCRLVCHASSKAMRVEYPIIGDLCRSGSESEAQAEFESAIFGDKVPGDDGRRPRFTLRGELPNG